MSNSIAKAREIEALTFIFDAAELAIPGARNRWFKFLDQAWVRVRKHTARRADFNSAGDWTFPGL